MDDIARYRLLNACGVCGRQYDVSHLDGGRVVRCECGVRFAVRVQKPHDPRALKCSSCGGLLKDEARKCEYCAAEITLEEQRLSAVCPKCFARTASDARFCMECGIAIAPQAIFALADGTACPRCKGALRSREVAATLVTECSACGGMWLTPEGFLHACEHADQARAAESAAQSSARQPIEAQRVYYIPCLACGQLMTRKNYASTSGVIIDLCKDHGVWLDHRELERIVAFVRGGGLARAREREIERIEAEQRRLRAAKAEVSVVGEHRLNGDWLGLSPARRTGVDVLVDFLFGAGL
jgi:Zn-finger nucleic acid-binding protein